MKLKFAGYVALRGILPVAFVIGNGVSVEQAWAISYMSVSQAQALAFGPEATFSNLTLVNLSEQTRGWSVSKSETIQGLFFTDQVIGKHFYIDYSVALDAHGHILRVDILEYRETHGGEVRNTDWLEQFKGASADTPLELGKDIRNISGATLSCKHITEGVGRITKVGIGILSGLLS